MHHQIHIASNPSARAALDKQLEGINGPLAVPLEDLDVVLPSDGLDEVEVLVPPIVPSGVWDAVVVPLISAVV